MIESIGLERLLAIAAAPFVGSFLGLLARRLPAGDTVVLGRSRCPHCGHPLGPRDLVPVLSWLVSRGRCRYCAAPLGLFYPAVEIGAVLVAVSAAAMQTGWLMWASCGLGWALLTLALIDLRHLVLPDELTLPLIPAGLAVAYALEPARTLDHLAGAVLGFAALYLVARVYRMVRGREGLGLGDAKLAAAAGAWVAWPGLPSVVLEAATIALAAALAGALAGRRLRWSDQVPFGPYLALATWLVWLLGPLTFG